MKKKTQICQSYHCFKKKLIAKKSIAPKINQELNFRSKLETICKLLWIDLMPDR